MWSAQDILGLGQSDLFHRIPFERALELANKEGITEQMYPLFVQDLHLGALLYRPRRDSPLGTTPRITAPSTPVPASPASSKSQSPTDTSPTIQEKSPCNGKEVSRQHFLSEHDHVDMILRLRLPTVETTDHPEKADLECTASENTITSHPEELACQTSH